jgi:hypothetical protein
MRYIYENILIPLVDLLLGIAISRFLMAQSAFIERATLVELVSTTAVLAASINHTDDASNANDALTMSELSQQEVSTPNNTPVTVLSLTFLNIFSNFFA